MNGQLRLQYHRVVQARFWSSAFKHTKYHYEFGSKKENVLTKKFHQKAKAGKFLPSAYSQSLVSNTLNNSYSAYPSRDFFLRNLYSEEFKNFYLNISAFGIPHVSKRGKLIDPPREINKTCTMSVGEDALFFSCKAFAVADGVGGWSSVPGSNSSLFARTLVDNIQNYFDKKPNSVDSVEIIQDALDHLRLSRDIIGGSTILLALLNGNNLNIANLGDCGIGLYRNGSFVFRSTELIHGFNCPFQLGSGQGADNPTDASLINLEILDGDIIVAGTDGLFDNLFDEEIVEILQSKGNNVNDIAVALVAAAAEASIAHKRQSPFSLKAVEEGLSYAGGKPDDISVVVGLVNRS